MSNPVILSTEKVIKHISNFPVNKLVFWVGAGIDNDFPTNFPLGNTLTQFLIEKLCTDYDLALTWRNMSEKINTVDTSIQIPKLPRLETIIESARVFEAKLFEHNHNTNYSTIRGLGFFNDPVFQYNNNHRILASLLSQGANIITTNFSNLILRAYEDQFCDLLDKYYDEVYHFHSKLDGVGGIYHIHGIADDLFTIGATLHSIKNPLPQFLTLLLDRWMDEGFLSFHLGNQI